jgi:hypothetical protein
VPLAIYTGARGSRFVCDSDKGFGELVEHLSHVADAPIQSCAREQAAEHLLRQIGHMSQRELYDCAQAKRRSGKCPAVCNGNCNPANPPGASTHERRNDGVAYRAWPRLFRLPVWARGIDVQRDRVGAFCAAARREGFTVTATYPGTPSEAQHVNFRKVPTINLWKIKPLKRGDGGRRASEVIDHLRHLIDRDDDQRYLALDAETGGKITAGVQRAIRDFQRDHHQTADGNVGIHTIRALRAARAAQKKGK